MAMLKINNDRLVRDLRQRYGLDGITPCASFSSAGRL